MASLRLERTQTHQANARGRHRHGFFVFANAHRRARRCDAGMAGFIVHPAASRLASGGRTAGQARPCGARHNRGDGTFQRCGNFLRRFVLHPHISRRITVLLPCRLGPVEPGRRCLAQRGPCKSRTRGTGTYRYRSRRDSGNYKREVN